MKRNKILFLLPFAGLILAGCSFQEVWGKVSGAFKNIISVDDAKKEEKSEEENKNENNNENQQGENQGQQGGNEGQGQGEQGGNEGQGQGEQGGGEVESGTYTFSFDTEEFTNTSGSKSGISFESAKADGASEPAYNATSKELRLYVNNTLITYMV